MAKTLKLRGGSTAECDGFVGASKEIIVDTEAKTIRVHDGETTGGVALSKKKELDDYKVSNDAEVALKATQSDFSAYKTSNDTEVALKSTKQQTVDTTTIYEDSANDKTYKLYVDDGDITLEEL